MGDVLRIGGPRLVRPGALDDLTPVSIADDPALGGEVRGRALIFWDPADPTRTRYAIDTDQITPTTDCVS